MWLDFLKISQILVLFEIENCFRSCTVLTQQLSLKQFERLSRLSTRSHHSSVSATFSIDSYDFDLREEIEIVEEKRTEVVKVKLFI